MSKIVIFSGAGVSADSGISTFRDSDGLWEKHNVADICTVGCLDTNREETLNFYDARRKDIEDKMPNLAHKTIAQLKNIYPDKISIITQNVDDMFERAGCSDILHLHGYLRELRCEKCSFIKDVAYEKQDRDKICPTCNARLRPNIVFFGEPAPKYEELYKHLEDCEVFVCIGTSGAVINVDMLSQWAQYKILNNLEPSNLINEDFFNEVYYERATTAIPKIANSLEKFLED